MSKTLSHELVQKKGADQLDPAGIPFSVFLWVRQDEKTVNNPYIVQQANDSSDRQGRSWLFRNAADDRLGTNIGNVVTYSGNPVFTNTGEWIHIGLTYNGQKVTLYVNGQSCGSALRTAEECSGSILIGRHKSENDSDYPNWNGAVDDLRIYKGVIGPDEIQRIFNHEEPVAHWTMDAISGNTISDSSSCNRSGTFNVASPTSICSGDRIGNAIQLQNSEYIQIDNWTGITGGNSRTCSGWIRTSQGNGQIFSWGEVATGKKWIVRVNSTGELRAEVQNGYIVGTKLLTDNKWHHIAVVLDNDGTPDISEVKLYVDGIRETISTVAACAIDTSATNNVQLGAYSPAPLYSNGWLDDLRIYSWPLSQEKIRQIANDMDLVAHWTLDELSGTTSADSSDNDITGTWNGGPVPSVEGFNNGAMEFDGTDDYITTSCVGILGTQDRTVSAWIKAVPQTVTTSETVLRSIVSWGGDTTGGTWNLAVNYVANEGPHGTIRLAANASKVVGTTRIDDNRWHHVAAVFSNDGTPTVSDIQLYIDGKKEVISYKVEAPLNTGTGMNVAIGAVDYPVIPPSGPKFYFKGKIDDVRIYDRALPEADLWQMYQKTVGGGIAGHGTSALIGKCVIKGNQSLVDGGGISFINGMLKNTLLIDNHSGQNGGGIAHSSGTIQNCTLANNFSISGGGLYGCNGDIVNSILWNNTPDQVANCNDIRFSCIQNWNQGGTGNIAYNPCFADPSQDNYSLLSYSSSIDAGCNILNDPASDYLNEPEDNGDCVNMGYMGNTDDAEIADRIADSDSDGLSNYQEIIHGTSLLNPDSDNDGLGDGDEVIHGTNPMDSDSDNDSLPDGWEIDHELNPLLDDGSQDINSNYASNLAEYLLNVSPDEGQLHYSISEYDYDDIGNVIRVTVKDGYDLSVLSVTETAYDEANRICQKRVYQNVDDLANHNSSSDIVQLTGYDVLSNVVEVVKKVDHVSGDAPELLQDGDYVTINQYDDYGRLEYTKCGIYDSNISLQDEPHQLHDVKQINYAYVDYTSVVDSQIMPPHDTLGTRSITSYRYDDAGRIRRINRANKSCIEYTYDSLGQTIRETVYDGHFSEQENDDTPHLQKRYGYDGLGNKILSAVMKDAASSAQPIDTVDVVQSSYYQSETGLLDYRTFRHETSEPLTTINFDYDEIGRLKTIAVNTDEVVKTLSYDEMDRVVTETTAEKNPFNSALNRITNQAYVYNNLGLLWKSVNKPDSENEVSWRQNEYVYDGIGQCILVVNPERIGIQYNYNSAGLLMTMVEDIADNGIGRTAIYSYDRLGRQKTVTAYPDNTDLVTMQTTYYEYNHDDQITEIRLPGDPTGSHREYSYYPNGSLRTYTNQNGWQITYNYDELGKNPLTKTVERSGSDTVVETFTYDALSRIETSAKSRGAQVISSSVLDYDDTGLIESEQQQWFEGVIRTVGYDYNAGGNLAKIDYPVPGLSITRTNTWSGQIQSLNQGTDQLLGYHYAGTSVVRREAGPTQIDYRYDAYGRVELVDAATSTGGVLSTISKEYLMYAPKTDSLQRRYYIHRGATIKDEFQYDRLNRLFAADYYDDVQEQFPLDDLGNRDGVVVLRGGSSQYEPDPVKNQYTINNVTCQYDAAGNLICDAVGRHYEYDYANHLVCVKAPDNTIITEYEYDAFSRRIWKKDYSASVPKEKYCYFSSDNQVLAEYDGNSTESTLSQWYLWGDYVDELILSNNSSSLANACYYIQNAQYSVTSVIGTNGTILERYDYDAYGKARVLNPDYSVKTLPMGNTVLYTGREYDYTTGLYDFRARTYDPITGRFLQHDQAGYIDTMNLYEYTKSSPNNYIDPSGNVVILVHGVNTDAAWYSRAAEGLKAYWKDKKQCPQEIIEFKWGEKLVRTGWKTESNGIGLPYQVPYENTSYEQGGNYINATDSVNKAYQVRYMAEAANRLSLIIQELNNIKSQNASNEPINVIAHSQGTILTAGVLRRTGNDIANFIMMGSPMNIFNKVDIDLGYSVKSNNDLKRILDRGTVHGTIYNYYSSDDFWASFKDGIGGWGGKYVSDAVPGIVNREFAPGKIIDIGNGNKYPLPNISNLDLEFDPLGWEYDHSDYMAKPELFYSIVGMDVAPATDRGISDIVTSGLQQWASDWERYATPR